MIENISLLLRLWSVQLLSDPRIWSGFVCKSMFQNDCIADWLGFDTETGVLAENGREPISRRRARFKKNKNQDERDSEFLKNANAGLKELRRQTASQRLTIAAFPELKNRLGILGRAYHLNTTEQLIWLVSLLRDEEPVFSDVLQLMNNATRKQYLTNLARMMKLPRERVMLAVRPGSNLFKLDLLRWESRRDSGAFLDCKAGILSDRFLAPNFSIEDLFRGTLLETPASAMQLADFPMLKENLAIALPYLKKAIKSHKPGVNILLYGDPGTGKTELSRVIGQAVKQPVYEIASEDHDARTLEANERMMALNKGLLLMRNRPAIIVFDEAEDLFRSSIFFSSYAQQRKGRFNQLLESNPVPVIWISNNIRSMDPAFLRRFDFLLEITPPNREQRKKILFNVGHQLLDEPLVEELADCRNLTPAVVERACRVVATLNRKDKAVPKPQRAVRLMLRNTLKAQRNPVWKKLESNKRREVTEFRMQYLSTDIDLDEVAENLRQQPECRMCLFGPPGTGKTSFGHFLSSKLDRPLVIKRASDLLSPYIGETEANMAAAFEEARREESILLIDEVDSFLRDRRGAVRTWEVTDVNEFLTQMEAFEGTFIASTNLVDDLDSAAARRFDFKIRFDYLRPGQAEALLIEQMERLGIPPASEKLREEVRTIQMLTPGDFANLSRQHRLRPFPSAEAFIDALYHEVKYKNECNSRRVGFA